MTSQALDQTFQTARQHHMAGRLDVAEGLYNEILDQDRQHADSLHLLGVLQWQRKQYGEATRLIAEAIKLNPAEAKYHSNLGNVLRDSGHGEEAIASYRRALSLDGGLAEVYHNLGTVLGEVGRWQEGIPALRRAIEIDPDYALSHGTLAMLLEQAGQWKEAIETARRAVALAPERTQLQMILARILLRQGQVAPALEIYEALLAAGRAPVSVLAQKAIALAELGESEAARQLMDPDLIVAQPIDLPDGWSLETFNRDLAAHASGHPSLMPSPSIHATRHGWHTGELANDDAPAIAILKDAIHAAARSRWEGAPTNPANPFWAMRPEHWALTLWAVVMEDGGHQIPHIHPRGWLSGVYYAQLPPEVGAAENDEAGWIEFGRAEDGFYRHSNPPGVLFEPAEGLMVTFPAFFWHRTVPFRSAGKRISFAFDILPAKKPASIADPRPRVRT